MGEPAPLKAFEENLAGGPKERYTFRLYVTGATARSGRAIENAKALCERYLRGRYDLEIVDIYQRPDLAEGDAILVAPTLIKQRPLPLRRLVGDLSDSERVLVRLDLLPVTP
ncbi:MAG TPA: circadian clock KaiB family protein [Thermoanaerobaculia bacterium]|nr:circadian clock KaiB family protein [Thermoanaerobaculia bacterium]